MTKLIDRFLRYVKVDTQANPNSSAHPTSPGQRMLAHYLADELRQIGMQNVRTSDQAYLYAELPATPGLENVPALGFIAHLDTSPDASGSCVCPSVIEYEGGDIPLGDSGRVLSPEEFSALRRLVGHRLIVTDGTTLLGADDKAGIAEIVYAMDTIISKGLPHGKLCVAFTTIHDYSLSKLIATTVVTVLGMLLVIFVIFMVVILLQQLFEFVYSIFIEVIYR